MAKLVKTTIEQIKFLKKNNLITKENCYDKKLAEKIIREFIEEIKSLEIKEQEFDNNFRIALEKS